jgi:pimeloyl-ACP methyl ester carboxylesterase
VGTTNIRAVVAVGTFSDLRTIASQRAPWLLTANLVERALYLAEQIGHFKINEVSPVASASRIHVPVLLIHGEADTDTPPQHSERVFSILAGPKRYISVIGATHTTALAGSAVWNEIDAWITSAFKPTP